MPGVERGRAEVALRRNDLRIEGLPTDGKVWRVVWYCGIHRNFLAPSEPRVAVLLISGGSGHYEHRVVNVGLTNLGLVEIGSRWTNGRYVDSAKTSVFDVVVDSATQRQFAPKFIRRLARVSDPSCLPYLGHQTAMLVEAAESDTVVVFPSLELFSRCFGSSQYVKRTLATLPFDEAYRQLTAPDRIPPDALAPGISSSRSTSAATILTALLSQVSSTTFMHSRVYGSSVAASRLSTTNAPRRSSPRR